ncbi:MAG: radical SAM protein [Promethearchaeota archaeon]|nr:MAG: radical SAM protein [Candidatus Lokiarchaeota archaeon]
MPREYTYGPFLSRRLGLSLGVNVLANYKLCTFNCVYCEIGLTKKENLVSPEFKINIPPSSNFRKELMSILKHVPHLNSITFGYNGEPTLNENILDFLDIAIDVRDDLKWTNVKPLITLFTNSSTLYIDEIRERVRNFELILAKLDVANDVDFKRTNRPHHDTPKIEMIIESLKKLKKELPKKHKLAIQCLIFNSYKEDFIPNNNSINILNLANALKSINPDIVQIYSTARIPAEYFVFSIDDDRKREISSIFKNVIDDDRIEINIY